MHLLQFIRAPSTGIHCHLALAVEGAAFVFTGRFFTVTAASSYLHFAGTQRLQ